MQSCMNVLRAQLLVSRVDQAVKLFPRVPMAPIVLGTLAACGGKFIVDAVNIASGTHSGMMLHSSAVPCQHLSSHVKWMGKIVN